MKITEEQVVVRKVEAEEKDRVLYSVNVEDDRITSCYFSPYNGYGYLEWFARLGGGYISIRISDYLEDKLPKHVFRTNEEARRYLSIETYRRQLKRAKNDIRRYKSEILDCEQKIKVAKEYLKAVGVEYEDE